MKAGDTRGLLLDPHPQSRPDTHVLRTESVNECRGEGPELW